MKWNLIMALSTRAAFCQMKAEQPAAQRAEQPAAEFSDKGKILLQPRVCTLRAFGGGRGGVMRARREENYQVSRFFETLSDYIESCRKSQDFEIISGRLSMIVFAATVSTEVATGNSIFKKMDLAGIADASGVCFVAVAFAAVFAWFSTNRSRVGRLLSISYNTFLDSLIDQIVDGLFWDVD